MNDCPRQNPAYRPAPTSFNVIVWKKINFSAEDVEDAKDYWVSEFVYRNHFVIDCPEHEAVSGLFIAHLFKACH